MTRGAPSPASWGRPTGPRRRPRKPGPRSAVVQRRRTRPGSYRPLTKQGPSRGARGPGRRSGQPLGCPPSSPRAARRSGPLRMEEDWSGCRPSTLGIVCAQRGLDRPAGLPHELARSLRRNSPASSDVPLPVALFNLREPPYWLRRMISDDQHELRGSPPDPPVWTEQPKLNDAVGLRTSRLEL